MSIADKIGRLTIARNNIRSALNDQGIDASNHGFEDFSADIRSIQSSVIKYSLIKQISLAPIDYAFPIGSTIIIDCQYFTDFTNMANAGYNLRIPGYEEIRLINIPQIAKAYVAAFGNHYLDTDGNGFKRLILDGNLILGNCNSMFTQNRALETISGGALDFTNATNANYLMNSSTYLVNVSIVPSSIKDDIKAVGPYLSQASIVSFINGLDGTVSEKTISLDATIKTGLSNIIGTVINGIFSVNASGDTNLETFATITKGWTIA